MYFDVNLDYLNSLLKPLGDKEVNRSLALPIYVIDGWIHFEPTLISPKDGDDVNNATPSFSWSIEEITMFRILGSM